MKLPSLAGDEDGLRVINYPQVANYIAQRLANQSQSKVILEICCGVGGTTVALAKEFEKVIAVDINPKRIKYAKKNIKNLGLTNKVEFITADIFDESILPLLLNSKIDIVHTDVEWTTSGNYGKDHAENLNSTSPSTTDLYDYMTKNVTKNICMRLPKSIKRNNFSNLVENIEIQEVYKNHELKFLYTYTGDLVQIKNSTFEFQD